MISETPPVQFPGPTYLDKGADGGITGPYGAEKGVSYPVDGDPMLGMHSGAFKTPAGPILSVLEGRKDPCALAVGYSRVAAQRKVLASLKSK
eukprot:CAMPEP_0168380656 /NCGR_PEP_ID=MMETSP0228-20121227/12475_1 /TAXON_ID=133427 /ORGANISM="Protoceratium reticulatum, Strain CCCM 535 (=CCMP 1889)" /LENGTH=91 /DNA_ID=CAMNT_0008393733 /DNA_START=36 /DNA_END=311 /DNA_ORIENTATION=-